MSPRSCHLVRPPLNARRRGRGFSRAFTLIELLVVIGIIILLVAILIPTLGRARNNARASQTQALMVKIGNSIDAYFVTFNAYPGPIPTYSGVATSTANTSGTKISGSQNLLLGLSYAMTPSSVTPTGAPAVSIPNSFVLQSGSSVSAYVDPSRANGPINYAAQQPNGGYEQLNAYFNPTPQQLSSPAVPPLAPPNVWPAGGVTFSIAFSPFGFPVLVDTFPDALPILYYRRSPGVDSPIASGTDPSIPAAYYLQENVEYTTANKLMSTSGLTFDETQGTFDGTTPHDNAVFKTFVQSGPSSGAAARGGYLLLSAGIDRIYGKYNGQVDDLTFVGGN